MPPAAPTPAVPAGAGLVVDTRVWGESGRALAGRPRRELSPRLAALLAEGDVDGVYDSRSAVAAAVALGAVAAGWSRDDYTAALRSVAHVPGSAGEWVERPARRARRRSPADQDRRIATTWRRAVERWHARPPATDRPALALELAEIRHAMDLRPWMWGGQAGAGNRAVMEALLGIAQRAGRIDPTASIRQIAEHTTVTDSTVDRAIGRLVELGWLRVDAAAGFVLAGDEQADGGRAGHALARQLHLRIPPRLPEGIDPDALADPATGELPALRPTDVHVHDAFTWRGLGAVAGVVYARLDPAQPVSARLLSTRSGFAVATVRGHLRRLADAGLAVAGPGGWRRGAADLDQVAAELGVAGTLQVRQERHEVQRARFTAYMTHFANRRGWRQERGLYRPHPQPRLALPEQRPDGPLVVPLPAV
jgi:hypothetical protein